MRHLGVMGAGAWGTALACLAATAGPVTLWARRAEVADEINRGRRNSRYLPGTALPEGVRAVTALEALAGCDALLAVVPAQSLRGVLGQAAVGGRPLLLCAKGIEAGTGLLPSEVAAAVVPHARVAVLSGPTFAAEVAAGLPTAVTLAAREGAELWVRRLAGPALRPYASDDVTGAEIGGAVKNVLAIGCGAVIGAGLGENARAALMARGFAEMTRYGVARGGRRETLTGLSGLGDLMLSCASQQSRNFRFGLALGRGAVPEGGTMEGAATAPALVADAEARGVDLPIARAVARLVRGEGTVADAMEALLSRPLRAEG